MFSTYLRRPGVAWGLYIVVFLAFAGILLVDFLGEKARLEAQELAHLETQTLVIDKAVAAQIAAVDAALQQLAKELGTATEEGKRAALASRSAVVTAAMPLVRSLTFVELGKAAPRSGASAQGLTLLRTVVGTRGDRLGTLAATLEPQALRPLLESVRYAPDTWVGITADEGSLWVGAVPNDVIPAHLATLVQRHASGPAEVTDAAVPMASGAEALTVLRAISSPALEPDHTLVVCMSRSREGVLESFWSDLVRNVVLFAVLLGSSSFLFWLLRRREGAVDTMAVQLGQVKERATDRVRLATHLASIGVWEYEVAADHLEWEDSMYTLYGTDRSYKPHHQSWALLVFAEDRPPVTDAWQRLLKTPGLATVSFRILRGNQTRTLRMVFMSSADEAGTVVRLTGINQDITDEAESKSRLEALNLELRKRTSEAEAATRFKTQFLANMSHEIRAPMNGVLGMTQVLLDTEPDAQQKRYLEIIQSSGQALVEIINDILDLTKIESGRLELNPRAFDPTTFLREFLAPAEVKAQEKGLALVFRTEGFLPPLVVADALRLRQVLTNIVGNAVKFTERGQVGVGVRFVSVPNPGSGRLEFEVTDTGIGMDEYQKSRLFQPFMQGDKTIADRFGGTGLGLSISQKLVTLMGGQITFDSRPGGGATFRFSVVVGLQASIEHVAEATRAAVRLDGVRILVVEDGPINQVVAKKLLEKAGARVEVLENGSLAVERLRAEPQAFDVILMDIQMPVMNGLQATKVLKNELKIATPIIALTAGAMEDEQKACRVAGMVDFVAKPFHKAEMISLIVKYL